MRKVVTTVERPKLTTKQTAIMEAVRESYHQRRQSPTLQEIQDATGISTVSVVSYNLEKLVGFGLIEMGQKRSSRRIVLVMAEGEECPCCGRKMEKGH